MREKALTLLTAMLLSAVSAIAQENIWAGVKDKPRVELTPYLAAGGSGQSVIVCPGGSYFWHDTETEGTGVARWLQAHGISAFVLRYRTAMVPAFVTHFRLLFRGRRYPDAQDDLTQALRHVRRNASRYGIDPKQVGAMGFSAGGHLVMWAAENLNSSERPSFVVSAYPVVSMEAPCTHRRSRRGLLGDSRTGNSALRHQLSLEHHVPADCVPVLLVCCDDDPVVDPKNSLLLDSALTVQKVPHRFLHYATGGHGFGMSDEKGTAESRQWREECLEWMKALKQKEKNNRP